jgi:hypothetical protein
MSKLVRIKSVQPLEKFTVRLGLTDGSEKTIDLAPYLRGPIFEPIRSDPAVFAQVTVDPRAGTVVWPNGADIDPDVLCEGLEPCWAPEPADTQASATGSTP